MPRYFFKVCDRFGELDDPHGLELPDDTWARQKALDGARSLICDDVRRGILDLGGRIEVTDEHGRLVLTVRFDQAVLRAT